MYQNLKVSIFFMIQPLVQSNSFKNAHCILHIDGSDGSQNYEIMTLIQ
jgi:hypothetical protein